MGHKSRVHWGRWLLAAVILAVALVWWASSSATVRGYINWLANQPDARTAYQEEGGSTDALIVLISFVLLTPLIASVVVMLVVFIMKMTEVFLVRVRLPEWASVPLVLAAFGYGTYAMRDAWLPESLHVLGLVARAYLVFSSATPGFR
jgi:hypothetical protein